MYFFYRNRIETVVKSLVVCLWSVLAYSSAITDTPRLYYIDQVKTMKSDLLYFDDDEVLKVAQAKEVLLLPVAQAPDIVFLKYHNEKNLSLPYNILKQIIQSVFHKNKRSDDENSSQCRK